MIVAPLEADAELGGVDPERQHQPPAGGELLGPGGGDLGAADGELDAVVGRDGRVALGAVGADDRDPRVAGGAQPLARPTGDLGVDVDRDDASALADELSAQADAAQTAKAT